MSVNIALERIQKAKTSNEIILDLSGLKLIKIPSTLSKLTHLTCLNLSNNQLTDILGLEKLVQLTKLYLGNNRLTKIKGLENLVQLSYLSLEENRINDIKGLTALTKLKSLYLGNNRLSDVKILRKLRQLVLLELTNSGITNTQGLEKLYALTELYLGRNQLTDLKGIESLSQLTLLDLSENEITTIQPLGKLTNLYSLHLGHNRLQEIGGLQSLTQLTKLNLGFNQLLDIKELEGLTNLQSLDLTDNKIKNLKRLAKLKRLTTLYLGNNQLTKTDGLEELTQLNSLHLGNNQLTELPEYLLSLGKPIYWETIKRKAGIYLENNPMTIPPPQIIQQGNKAIQEYFDQRRKSGEEVLSEAKLILLGDGRSGKTSLANRLLGKGLPQEVDRTQGVDISIGEYGFRLANGRDFRINIWDFAGQDKYKTLHQLFYTDSSLYVMVAESGNTTTDYDDWFQTAALFGEGSPLILLLNEFKSGIGIGSFDSAYWKRQFPELLKVVISVNLGTKQNFTTAEEFIRLLAQTLPHTKYAFPSNWATIRRLLNDRRNEQFITLKEYLKICKDNGLLEKESALILSSVLHKVGDCLHYQKSSLLKQFIILKNEWATEAVYKILDDKIVSEDKCGFFDLSDLERIWDSHEYEDMRPQLLELMRQFKLAYQLPGKDEFVTPPLLPLSRPIGYSWPKRASLELYIEFEFLPKALLTQFIVTRHADIADGRTLVWRHGVVLKWENEALAEVSKTKLLGRDAIHIRTQGNNRKGMMTIILKTFRELHADYKGIKYSEKVPCNCVGCRTGNNNQHYFDFVNLQLRLEKGRYEVECDKSLETLNVLALLENTFVFEKFKEGRTLQLKENVAKENHSIIRKFSIFLASSNELFAEREKIEQSISRKKESFRKQGFAVDLLIWEDGKHIGKSLRSQDNHNLEIEQCDLFVMMFYSKVGKYSLEEFNLASGIFQKNNGMPRIRIFQKDLDLPKDLKQVDSNSRFKFIRQLKKIEHFPILFENVDRLVNELEDAIDKLLQEDDFVKMLKVKGLGSVEEKA